MDDLFVSSGNEHTTTNSQLISHRDSGSRRSFLLHEEQICNATESLVMNIYKGMYSHSAISHISCVISISARKMYVFDGNTETPQYVALNRKWPITMNERIDNGNIELMVRHSGDNSTELMTYFTVFTARGDSYLSYVHLFIYL